MATRPSLRPKQPATPPPQHGKSAGKGQAGKSTKAKGHLQPSQPQHQGKGSKGGKGKRNDSWSWKAAADEEEEDFGEVEVELEDTGDDWCDDAGASAEAFDFEGEEAEAAAQGVDADLAFEEVNQENSQDGHSERELLARLRKAFLHVLPGRPFILEPFGSFVTDLGLPNSDGGGRSDLDMVLLFRNQRADTMEAKEVRDRIVSPTINALGRWFESQPGFTVKNIIRRARVPIVMFDTEDLSCDVSVQQPFGVLNSWHLRDLCASGWPGRLKALVRLVKMWAKSKSIHTAKDGALSSYGYAMLSAGFLQEIGALPAILHLSQKSNGPYLSGDEALNHVLNAGQSARPAKLWGPPEPWVADASQWEEALLSPIGLFTAWLRWLLDSVLGGEVAHSPDYGSIPVESRHIVSVRGLSQEDLRADISWAPKADHWAPATSKVWMLIEEPLTGENVARCVRDGGFRDILAEVERSVKHMERASSTSQDSAFKALLRLQPLNKRNGPAEGVGLARPAVFPVGALKRPFDGASQAPPFKRQNLGQGFAAAHGQPWQSQPWQSHQRPRIVPPIQTRPMAPRVQPQGQWQQFQQQFGNSRW
eukprot:TRINITY_DN109194_c0_g1_i1.p1 TRINITY_DN109194_c0_g1~~TRINITY_DN109194_c0_g1_i1.p1  ORF type:complete len:603 (+),score=112.62 TRINITY_DN109194_c0_g1_i1:34-1809(+)